MSTLKSVLDPKSDTYTAAASAAESRLEEIDAELAKALAGGGTKYVERHHDRGKLTARERIELLVDADSPFLELCPLAAYGSAFQIGASTVTGIGAVNGVECMIVANDPTVKGGTSNPWTLRKMLASQPDRDAEPTPGDLAGGIRRRGSADAERNLRSRRPDVPRPDPAVGGRHPDHRVGVRQLDRGRAPTCPACPITW